MSKLISIPVEEYNVLRETFNRAITILDRFGGNGSKTSENKKKKVIIK